MRVHFEPSACQASDLTYTNNVQTPRQAGDLTSRYPRARHIAARALATGSACRVEHSGFIPDAVDDLARCLAIKTEKRVLSSATEGQLITQVVMRDLDTDQRRSEGERSAPGPLAIKHIASPARALPAIAPARLVRLVVSLTCISSCMRTCVAFTPAWLCDAPG